MSSGDLRRGIYTHGPQLNDGLTYDFSTLLWCESYTCSVETVLRILVFSRASDTCYDTLFDTGV